MTAMAPRGDQGTDPRRSLACRFALLRGPTRRTVMSTAYALLRARG
jgi:hypothetical protein